MNIDTKIYKTLAKNSTVYKKTKRDLFPYKLNIGLIFENITCSPPQNRLKRKIILYQ